MDILPVSRGISRRWRWIIGVGAAAGIAAVWPPMSKLAGQILLALLLAAMALPLCRKMERKFSRKMSAWAAVAALLLFFAALLGLLTPRLLSQATLLMAQAPALLRQITQSWNDLNRYEFFRRLRLADMGPESWLHQLSDWAAASLPRWIAGIGAGADALSRAFLSPVLAYYFLRDRENFCYRLSLWIPGKHRKRMLTAVQEMRREAGGYVRGQALVALAVALLTAAGLMLVGIPAWLALGLLMGLCEFIPYIGPLIGGIPIVLFSLPLGVRTLLWALGVTVLVQQLEGYFLSPRLMAGATGLHPVAVILLLSAGGYLGGLMGMVAAVPAFVCVRGAARVLYETREKEQF